MADQKPWETDPDAALAEAERRIAEWEGGPLFLDGVTALDQLPNSLFGLKGLTELFLNNTEITDRGVREVAQMQGLTELFLNNTEITDSGVRDIAQMQGLTILDLSKTEITDRGVRDIAQMQGITQLYLSKTEITDSGVRDIAQMQGLTELDLSKTEIADSGVRDIAQMQGLTELDLSNTQITDSGVKDIAQMQGLTVLYLNNTLITDLRMFWGHENLFSGKGLFSGIYFNGLSDSAAPELREIGDIDNNDERMSKLKEYLESLPPWPEPLDGGQTVEPSKTPIKVDHPVKVSIQADQLEVQPNLLDANSYSRAGKLALVEVKEAVDTLQSPSNFYHGLATPWQKLNRGLGFTGEGTDYYLAYMQLVKLRGIYERRNERIGDQCFSTDVADALHTLSELGFKLVREDKDVAAEIDQASKIEVILNPSQFLVLKEIGNAIAANPALFGELLRDISNGLGDIHKEIKRASESLSKSTTREVIEFLCTVAGGAAGGAAVASQLGLSAEQTANFVDWIKVNADKIIEAAAEYGPELLKRAQETIGQLPL